MRILLDTHFLLWIFIDSGHLSSTHKSYLLDESNEIYYSPVSLWEISIKYSLGKLDLQGITPEEFYAELTQSFVQCLPIMNQTLVTSYQLPRLHKDPFDRLLIWQAIENHLYFLSVDQQTSAYSDHGLLCLNR